MKTGQQGKEGGGEERGCTMSPLQSNSPKWKRKTFPLAVSQHKNNFFSEQRNKTQQVLYVLLLYVLHSVCSRKALWLEVGDEFDMEGLLLLGGGTEESPSAAGLLLDSQGLLCRPHPAQASLDLPLGLWGAGAVRVDGGVVACGGRTDYGRINNKVRKERERGREGGRQY